MQYHRKHSEVEQNIIELKPGFRSFISAQLIQPQEREEGVKRSIGQPNTDALERCNEWLCALYDGSRIPRRLLKYGLNKRVIVGLIVVEKNQ